MIGIRSMQQRRIEHEWRERRVLKFEEKRGKKKKKRNERDHNDIRYCDFITAELILFGSESLRIAFRFRGVKTPAANTLQYPSLLALFFASLLAGQYLSGPNYSPPASRKNRKNSKAPLNCVHPRLPSPSFTDFQRLFLSSRLVLSSSPSHDRSPLCACVPFYRARLEGCHPPPLLSFSSLLLLSPTGNAFEPLDIRATEQNQSFRNERRRFSRLPAFSTVWTVAACRFAPLLHSALFSAPSGTW